MTVRWGMVHLLVVLLLGPLALSAEPQPRDEPNPLTVEQTLGLLTTGGGANIRLCLAANPDAKGALYRILGNDGLWDYHPSALVVLGHIGDAKDSANIVDIINSCEGRLSPREDRIIQCGMSALGTMASRGIVEAGQSLRAMASPTYWDHKNVQCYPDEVVESAPEVRYMPAQWAFYAYVMTGGKDFEPLAEKAIAEAENLAPDAKARWANIMQTKGLDAEWEKLARILKEPITEADRAQLDKAYLRNKAVFAGEKERPSEVTERPFIGQMIEAATSEFYEAKMICFGDCVGLEGRVLRNGRAISNTEWREHKMALRAELTKQLPILKALEDGPLAPHDYSVVRTISYEKNELGDRGILISGTKEEGVTVSFHLAGTKDIGSKFLADKKGTLTVADDGSLIVVMKKIGDKWYWNPFGW